MTANPNAMAAAISAMIMATGYPGRHDRPRLVTDG
jgi:hypothetical protein